jgi:hypothetical protein
VPVHQRPRCGRSIQSLDTMLTLRRGFAIPTLMVLSLVATAATHITAYPKINPASAQAIVVVAQVSPGGMLPPFEECKKRTVICLHSPLWFRARVLQTIFGKAPGIALEVATTSHYGMQSYEYAPNPRLLLLLIDGDKVLMPTYSQAELTRRDDGELFLPTPSDRNPFWLPCSVSTLREEISPNRFPKLEGIPRQDLEGTDTEHPELFVIIHGKAYPRYGIRLAKLQAHLKQLAPNAESFRCEQDDGV